MLYSAFNFIFFYCLIQMTVMYISTVNHPVETPRTASLIQQNLTDRQHE